RHGKPDRLGAKVQARNGFTWTQRRRKFLDRHYRHMWSSCIRINASRAAWGLPFSGIAAICQGHLVFILEEYFHEDHLAWALRLPDRDGEGENSDRPVLHGKPRFLGPGRQGRG